MPIIWICVNSDIYIYMCVCVCVPAKPLLYGLERVEGGQAHRGTKTSMCGRKETEDHENFLV